jgi:hypothetical protein
MPLRLSRQANITFNGGLILRTEEIMEYKFRKCLFIYSLFDSIHSNLE